MEEQTSYPVLFLDSGIGGIPYCRHFNQRNPGVPVVYVADRLYFPYGRREKKEILAILTGHINHLVGIFNPKIIVLACNTATIAALSLLREHFPDFIFVGTVPAVKPAALASKTGKIGVLGTEVTIKESYIRDLAATYGSAARYGELAKNSDNEIIGIAAPELVEYIEFQLNSTSPEEKTQMVRKYLNRFRDAGADVLVLGCTHFLFLLSEFQKEAAPDIAVFESTEGISQRIESLLELQPEKDAGTVSNIKNRLVLTGSSVPEPSWTDWAEYLGFSLSLLEGT
jgi:glutamate racemase